MNLFNCDTEDGKIIKVLDFGIAKTQDQSLTGDGIIGTMTHMSPEHALNKKLDGRADLYSLGVVLFELVSDSLPFLGETPVQTLMMHIQEPPPPLRDRARVPVSDGYVRIVEKALQKDPFDRFSDAAEMVEALLALKQNPSAEFPQGREVRRQVAASDRLVSTQTTAAVQTGLGDADQTVLGAPIKLTDLDQQATVARASPLAGLPPAPQGLAPIKTGLQDAAAASQATAYVDARPANFAHSIASTQALEHGIQFAVSAAAPTSKPAATNKMLMPMAIIGVAAIAVVAFFATRGADTPKAEAPAPVVTAPASAAEKVTAPLPVEAKPAVAPAAPAPAAAAPAQPAAVKEVAPSAPDASAAAAPAPAVKVEEPAKAAEPANKKPAGDHKIIKKKTGGSALDREL